MPTRVSRSFMLALILSLPPLMLLVAPRSSGDIKATTAQTGGASVWSLLILVEGIIATGMVLASRERERFLLEQGEAGAAEPILAVATPSAVPGSMHASVKKRRVKAFAS